MSKRKVVEYRLGETNDASQYRFTGWKGFEKEVEKEPNFICDSKVQTSENELDMTPMVDVTFLLLIFFMVTASFVAQKAIHQPPASSELNPTVQIEPKKDLVEVLIDQNNTYYVKMGDEVEVESPSERDMRSRVKDAFESAGAVRLVICAHVDSKHRKVVTAYDAGVVAGLEDIEIKTMTEDF